MKKSFFPAQENSKQLNMSQFCNVFEVFQFRFSVPSWVTLRYMETEYQKNLKKEYRI